MLTIEIWIDSLEVDLEMPTCDDISVVTRVRICAMGDGMEEEEEEERHLGHLGV